MSYGRGEGGACRGRRLGRVLIEVSGVGDGSAAGPAWRTCPASARCGPPGEQRWSARIRAGLAWRPAATTRLDCLLIETDAAESDAVLRALLARGGHVHILSVQTREEAAP